MVESQGWKIDDAIWKTVARAREFITRGARIGRSMPGGVTTSVACAMRAKKNTDSRVCNILRGMGSYREKERNHMECICL